MTTVFTVHLAYKVHNLIAYALSVSLQTAVPPFTLNVFLNKILYNYFGNPKLHRVGGTETYLKVKQDRRLSNVLFFSHFVGIYEID